MTATLLTAIALMCQVTGSSYKESATYKDAQSQQKACQKELIKCFKSKKSNMFEGAALAECIESY